MAVFEFVWALLFDATALAAWLSRAINVDWTDEESLGAVGGACGGVVGNAGLVALFASAAGATTFSGSFSASFKYCDSRPNTADGNVFDLIQISSTFLAFSCK